MTIDVHLRIVGALLVCLGLSHALFNRYFGWEKELAAVSLLTRRIFFVHSFFIGLGLVLSGGISFFCAEALLQPGRLSSMALGSMVIFWLCRLITQFFVYDTAIWRGRPLWTAMHVAFCVLWCYVSGTYGIALYAVLAG